MGAVWFVTGSSRGLGKAIVEFALASGDRVVATCRNPGDLDSLVGEYGGNRVRTLPLDVTQYDEAVSTANKAMEQFGPIDIVVNNAGWSDLTSVEDQTIDEFRRHIDVNFFGVVNVTKAFIPILRRQGRGHIFQVGSVGGRVATPGQVAYQSAKWAVNGFSTGVAQELAPFGVKVTALEPGSMPTDFAGSSMSRAPVGDHYQDTVGYIAKMIGKAQDSPPTRPERVGKVIKQLYTDPHPPLRLLLGTDAVTYAAHAAKTLMESDEKWKHLSVGE